MEKKTAKELFHEVDPDLNVVGGRHFRKTTEQDWLAATGQVCSQCHREFQQGKDGLCMPCWQEKQDNTLEVRDPGGVLNYFGDIILKDITHKAKNDK